MGESGGGRSTDGKLPDHTRLQYDAIWVRLAYR